MNESITIIVNGKHQKVLGHISLSEFLESLALQSRFIAIGYNGQVLQKDEYETIYLKDLDVLELVRPVGGG